MKAYPKVFWKGSDGNIVVSDRKNGNKYDAPSVDAQQDLVGISYTSVGGKNVFVFKRKLDTGDSNDIAITPESGQFWV